ncbi:ankyrin repeat-containing domain protein [Neocallimastix sp. 'constans']
MKYLDIDSFVSAIDNRDVNEIEILVNNNENIGKDIIYEMYTRSLLTPRRLRFIMKNCLNYFNISSVLLKQLIKNGRIFILDNIFENIKIYDNDFILDLLIHYKNEKAISTTELNQQISIEKYRISTKDWYYHNSGKYLYNECIEDSNNIMKIKFLVEHGVDLNKEHPIIDITPLFIACRKGDEKIVKYFVEHGADINKENEVGETPLFNACDSGNEVIINCLIKLGADINKENINGETPLFRASEYGKEAALWYLIEHGADINKENINGETPLFRASEYGKEVIVYYLIEHGVDINKENKDYETALFKACRNGKENVVKCLIGYGADINRVNMNNETPLSVTTNRFIRNFLVEHGAKS